MIANKEAYELAYQRALSGRHRPIWELAMSPFFEDQYTRQAREQGERDGLAARTTAEEPEAEMPASQA